MYQSTASRNVAATVATGCRVALLLLAAMLLAPGAAGQTGVLFVENDKVGIGTSTPEFDFEVEGPNSRVLVDTTSGAASNRTLLELRNSGAVQVFLANTEDNITWQMSGFKSSLQLSRAGVSAGTFRVLNSGGLQALNGSTMLMKLTNSGDLEIAGTLAQGSSRDLKTAISPVDGESILQRVTQLPINTWAYKGKAEQSFHIGPMAEDFHASFGLGADEAHLAPGDVAGVALVSVQELYARLQSETEKRQQLEVRNLELEERLEALEALVLNSAAAN